MNEVMILRRGGGGNLFAAIGVTYPASNTCTCSNGKKTLVAKAKNGQWIFSIPKPASLPERWTVTSTDGVDSKSKDVSIDSEGQCVTVNLKETVLFDRSNSAGWISLANVAGKGSAAVDNGIMSISGAIDVGGHAEYYTFLRYYAERIDTTSAGTKLRISASGFTANAKLVAFTDPSKVCPGILNNSQITYNTVEVLASQTISATGAEMELPVGNYYVGILVDGNGQVSTPKVWIE